MIYLLYPERFPFLFFFGAASFLMFLYDFISFILDLLPIVPSLLPFFVADTVAIFGIDKDL